MLLYVVWQVRTNVPQELTASTGRVMSAGVDTV
jgi:hypothetical protein